MRRITGYNHVSSLFYGIIHTGQSLSTGDFGAPISTTNVGGNLQLFDSSGNYNLTAPFAGTLSLINLVAPIRADKFTGTGGDVSEYPINIGGESPEVSMSNTLATLLSQKFIPSCVGQGGAAMSVIEKNGTGNAFRAAIYEAKAIHYLQAGYQVAATMLTHGEADSTVAVATYQAQIVQLQSDLQSDIKAVTGQVSDIPMLVSQQNAFPGIGGGTINKSAIAQWNACVASPNSIVGVCPKYQYTYQGDRAHLTNTGYKLLGEKYAQALYHIITIGSWKPLYAIGFSRTGNAISVSFNLPVPPLVFDGVSSAPHQSGTTYGDNGSVFGGGHTGWTAGKGFELWSGGYGGTPIAITSCTITVDFQVIVTGASQPDTVSYAMTPDNVTGGTFTGGFPDGRCGLLQDSDTFAGLSGTVQTNRCWAFIKEGL